MPVARERGKRGRCDSSHLRWLGTWYFERRNPLHRVSLDKALTGSVIARTVYSHDGVLLLSEGMRLTEEHKRKLSHNGVSDLFIEQPEYTGLTVSDIVRQEVLTDVKAQVKDIMAMPSLKAGIDAKRVADLIELLLDDILTSGEILSHLNGLRSIDENTYTFSHSVNVAVYAMVTGIGMDMSRETLKELGTGAIMHDVGKMMVDGNILQKPGGLTQLEFEEVKKHTVLGYELLQKIEGMGNAAAQIALSHHERMDGSGYPRGMSGIEIPLASRIVAVADVYDALTSDRVYRVKEDTHKVLDYIANQAGSHFDRMTAEAFVRQIAHYPVGTAVVLLSGSKGLVSRQNRNLPHRPCIRVVIDADGVMLKRHQELDLSQSNGNRIAAIWDI